MLEILIENHNLCLKFVTFCSGTDGETGEEDYFLSHPYHLVILCFLGTKY